MLWTHCSGEQVHFHSIPTALPPCILLRKQACVYALDKNQTAAFLVDILQSPLDCDPWRVSCVLHVCFTGTYRCGCHRSKATYLLNIKFSNAIEAKVHHSLVLFLIHFNENRIKSLPFHFLLSSPSWFSPSQPSLAPEYKVVSPKINCFLFWPKLLKLAKGPHSQLIIWSIAVFICTWITAVELNGTWTGSQCPLGTWEVKAKLSLCLAHHPA